MPPLRSVTLEKLEVVDEKDVRHIALYADLREILVNAKYPFRVLPAAERGRWDRALFLNLTYWGASDGGDVLVDRELTADVVAHVALHHLAAKSVGSESVDALFLGESMASAFDLYLVGRLLGRSGKSSFLMTQVPAMADAASAAGLTARKFEGLLGDVASDPEGAFEDLRALLFTVTRELFECTSAGEAEQVFARHAKHRFSALLHHYELSNWVLFARAHGNAVADKKARAVHRALTAADVSLDWLEANWIAPALKSRRVRSGNRE